MKYNIPWLQAQPNPDYLFFWGHKPSKDGSIIKTCMSQWWLASFTEDQVVYATAEHYMMAGKACLFGDAEVLAEILKAEAPDIAKKLGRKVRNFDPVAWDAHKYELVKQGNLLKFSQNDPLKHFLLGTGNAVLVEASPVDPVWGIGLSQDDPGAADPAKWRGENLLGFALMEVRDQLRESN